MERITADTKLKYVLYGLVIGIFIFLASTYFAATFTDKNFKPVGTENTTEARAQMIGFLIGAWVFSYLGISMLVIVLLIILIIVMRRRY